jgi:glycosyltransferase involved in cell wall biosynthesis
MPTQNKNFMMQYLAYISIGFVAFQLANVLLNLFFRQRIRKTMLPPKGKISILIPARNEEHNIGLLLEDLREMKSNSIEIIVFNDQSTDNTSSIVQNHAIADKRIKLIQSEGLPQNWLGKNHACFQLAKQATGSYYLFLDADVRLANSIIEDAVSYLEKHHLSLLSVFPIQIQKNLSEKISVSIMNYILLTLLPLISVRISPFSSHSAANGQFMLFRATCYKKIQPHKIFKTSAVEDIAISRYYKKKKIRIACITGDNRIKCRMYKNYKQALNGFSKNIFTFFGNHPALAFLFWIFAALGFIPIWLSQPNLLLIYISLTALTQVFYSVISKQNIVLSTLLFPAQLFFMLQVMTTSILNHKNQQYSWKGRNIYS